MLIYFSVLRFFACPHHCLILSTPKKQSDSSLVAFLQGVLHPIFEEDEATLIAIGGGLGMAAGFLQALAPY